MYKNLSIRSIVGRSIHWGVLTLSMLVIVHFKVYATALLGQDRDLGIRSAQLELDLVELKENFIMSWTTHLLS